MRRLSPGFHILTGVLVALVTAELLIRVVGPQMPDQSLWPTVETDLKSHQLVDLKTEPTLLLLGSSISEAAVDPVILESLTGLSSIYNSAMPFSSPLSMEIWLEEVVEGMSARFLESDFQAQLEAMRVERTALYEKLRLMEERLEELESELHRLDDGE